MYNIIMYSSLSWKFHILTILINQVTEKIEHQIFCSRASEAENEENHVLSPEITACKILQHR